MIEQIELVTCGSVVMVVKFKNKLDAITHGYGRAYHHPTNASLERLVNLMNEKMDLELIKEGKTITTVAWKRYASVHYDETEWERMQDDAPRYEPDQWGD